MGLTKYEKVKNGRNIGEWVCLGECGGFFVVVVRGCGVIWGSNSLSSWSRLPISTVSLLIRGLAHFLVK